jgi:hypothetical protein
VFKLRTCACVQYCTVRSDPHPVKKTRRASLMSTQLHDEIVQIGKNRPPFQLSTSNDCRHDHGIMLEYYTEPVPFRLVYSSSVLFAGRCVAAGVCVADSDVIIKVFYGADGMAAGTRERAAMEKVSAIFVVELFQVRAHMNRNSMILVEEKWSMSLGALLLSISDISGDLLHRKQDLQRQVRSLDLYYYSIDYQFIFGGVGPTYKLMLARF